MQNEYDFSNPQRGKFYRKDATLELPIYLAPQVRDYLAARAKARSKRVSANAMASLLDHDVLCALMQTRQSRV